MPQAADDRPPLPEVSFPYDHIHPQLAMHVECGDGTVIGRFMVRRSMWGTGSKRPRLSLFALAMDNLSGHLPDPVRFPTVDLRAQFVSEPPTDGWVELHGRTLRVGRRIVVSEFEFCDADGARFGRGITTMSNNPYGGFEPDEVVEPVTPIPSFDALFDTRIVDERSLDLDPSPQLSNGVLSTPHGGAQTFFCELAAEHLAGHPSAAADVDIHFLQGCRAGPLRATATHVGAIGGLSVYRVDLTDLGADDVLVAAATVVSTPLTDER